MCEHNHIFQIEESSLVSHITKAAHKEGCELEIIYTEEAYTLYKATCYDGESSTAFILNLPEEILNRKLKS